MAEQDGGPVGVFDGGAGRAVQRGGEHAGPDRGRVVAVEFGEAGAQRHSGGVGKELTDRHGADGVPGGRGPEVGEGAVEREPAGLSEGSGARPEGDDLGDAGQVEEGVVVHLPCGPGALAEGAGPAAGPDAAGVAHRPDAAGPGGAQALGHQAGQWAVGVGEFSEVTVSGGSGAFGGQYRSGHPRFSPARRRPSAGAPPEGDRPVPLGRLPGPSAGQTADAPSNSLPRQMLCGCSR